MIRAFVMVMSWAESDASAPNVRQASIVRVGGFI
jgi:hypothetical protein